MRGAGLIGYFARHGTAANLLVVLMVTAGLWALTQIRSQFFPDVVIETVTVRVAWTGAGPAEVDDAIVGPLEPVLRGLDGVERVTAVAREGVALLSVDFEPGTDMTRASEDVKAAVDSVRNLPAAAEAPVIRRAAWRDLVTDVVIAGPLDTQGLTRLADEFVGRLFRAGITRTTVRGVADPRITVEMTEAAMVRHGVTLAEVAAAIGAAADADPAGGIAGTATRVRTGVASRTAEEIGAVPVRMLPDGSRLHVRDVARVTLEGAETRIAYFVGSHPAVAIRVDRDEAGDAIAMQRMVARIAAEMRLTLPEGVTIDLVRKRAEAISDRLDLLIGNGMIGLLLVLGLLFLFLDARTALWVAAGIPAAMLAGLGLMHLAGITLNMVSLFALILCLGIVVDDAIVVGEYTDQLHRHRGLPPTAAAVSGAYRMAAPVAAASLTTVIAFAALTLIGGRMGTLVADIPFTVGVVILASLVECFLVLPNHLRHGLAGSLRRAWYDWPSRTFNRLFRAFVLRVFRPFVALAVRGRYPVLALALLALAHAVSLHLSGRVPFVFFNAPEEGSVSGSFAMAPGATRADTAAMLAELQRAVAAVSASFRAPGGPEPVTFVMGQIGSTAGTGLADEEGKEPDQLGGIALELVDPDLRPWTSRDFVARLEAEVRRHPLLETLSFRAARFGPGGNALEVKLSGEDPAVLKAAAEDLKARLADFPIVSGLEDSLAWDKTELVVTLTPQGEALGLTTEAIGAELYRRLSGIEAARFPVGLRTGTVRVRMAEAEMAADFLARARIATPAGQWVALADVARVTPVQGFASIRREGGLRVVTVTGDVDEGNAGASVAFRTALRATILPAIAETWGVAWEQGGLAEQEQRFLSEARTGFLACLVGIFACLAWVFGSWTRPIVVMAIIPFGFVGAVWGHLVWEMPLSMFSVVGLIGMTGIIINDSIVLVSTVDEYARGRALRPALVDAVADRLRPVLLTTLTTVLGMGPLLYEPSVQAQFLKPTVITLCYGLGFGVLVVLLVVPALVAVQRDVARLLAGVRRALGGRSRLPSAPRRVLRLAGAALLAAVAATAGLHALSGGRAAGLGALLFPGLGPLAGAAAGLLALAAAIGLAAAVALLRAGRAGGPGRAGAGRVSRAGRDSR